MIHLIGFFISLLKPFELYFSLFVLLSFFFLAVLLRGKA